MNERFVSNITGDLSFFNEDRQTVKTLRKQHNFSLKKKNQMWAAHYRNFDKHFFRQGNCILPFECMICVKYNRRYHFFDYDLRNANSDNKHFRKRLANMCRNTDLHL